MGFLNEKRLGMGSFIIHEICNYQGGQYLLEALFKCQRTLAVPLVVGLQPGSALQHGINTDRIRNRGLRTLFLYGRNYLQNHRGVDDVFVRETGGATRLWL